MATPYNAPYKKLQRKANENRDIILWRSCVTVNIESNPMMQPILVKKKLQGTYIKKIHGRL